MALIRSLEDDRVKNLKSLSYGAVKPLVTKDINKRPSPEGIGLQASRRIDDLTRIAKFFTTPSGLKFIGNQALLQQVGLGDKIRKAKQDGKTTGGAILQQLGKTALNTGAIIGSTLAQVPVNGTGTHFFIGFRGRGSFYSNAASGINNPTLNNIEPGESNLFAQSPANTTDKVITTDSIDKIQDFRDSYGSPNINVNKRLYSLDYNDNKIKRESRVNLGDQGRPRQNFAAKGYTQPPEGPELDGINMLPPIKLTSDNKTTLEDGREVYDKEAIGVGKGRDLIKFRFEVVTPDESTILYFRAFLDSFSDDYSGNWSSNSYLGRGEAFYTYEGFDRSMQLSFKIAAATRHEMQPLYQKIVFLASSTAPTYSSNFMRGSLVKLTVGDYVYDTPGFIENISYSWQQDYPWEIAMSRPENTQDQDMQELPQVLDVTVNFKPIHRFTPQTGLYHYITNPGFGQAKRNLFFSQNNQTKPRDSKDIVNGPTFPSQLLSKEQQEAILNSVDEQAAIAEAELQEQELNELDSFLENEEQEDQLFNSF